SLRGQQNLVSITEMATISHRVHELAGIEFEGLWRDMTLGYEHFKRATGLHDFFKARHQYTMLDVMQEWELFLGVFEELAAHFAPQLKEQSKLLPFVYRMDEIRFRPPILYPNKVLNAGSNYYDHALEMGAAAPDHDKHEPYFFYKGSRRAPIGHAATIGTTPRA